MLESNLKENDIPLSIFEMEIDRYDEFLNERRKLISHKLKNYYKSL